MRFDDRLTSTEAALRERVKELTCLYSIAQLAVRTDLSHDEILSDLVSLLPSAWQYPEITGARITFDEHQYRTEKFQESRWKQVSDIVIEGISCGKVEVVYTERRPEIDEGPFLKEERSLIDAVAEETGMIITRWRAEDYHSQLQEQLRHADRLATIGLLAAGVAHELNEPLGNILGFAQLVKKCSGLPAQAAQDIARIESSSLHAREVIRNLLVFARQLQPQKLKINLNKIVSDGLYFFEARCEKDGIQLVRTLATEPLEITGDPAQLHQVLVNLVVNSLQSMPEGGTLTLRTLSDGEFACMILEDTGCGMDKDTMNNLFVPFFTTKEVGQGTGLGLPVVHGIVTSHGGHIEVESKVGEGTRFQVLLPQASLLATEQKTRE